MQFYRKDPIIICKSFEQYLSQLHVPSRSLCTLEGTVLAMFDVCISFYMIFEFLNRVSLCLLYSYVLLTPTKQSYPPLQ